MNEKFDTATRPDGGSWGTVDGQPITEETIEALVADAEAGFPKARVAPVGRPRTVGKRPAETVTVRLDPERIDAVRARARREHTSASDILRRALDEYLAG